MVSKENEQINPQEKTKIPSGNKRSLQNKQVTEGKEKTPEGKKNDEEKPRAYPLGFPEGKEKVSEGKSKNERVPSGDDKSPSGKSKKNKQLSNDLREGDDSPSGEKEETIMDEETKKRFSEVIGTIKEGNKELSGHLKEVGEALKARQTNPASATETTPKKEPSKETPSGGFTAEQVRDIIREEQKREQDEAERQRRAQENRAKVETYDKRLSELENWKKKCDTEGDTIACQRVEALEKEMKQGRPEAEKARSELEPLEAMTPEKRKGYTEEQNKQRTQQTIDLMKRLNITYQDAWNALWGSPEDQAAVKDKLYKSMSDEDLEALIKSRADVQKGKIVGVLCEGGVCKVKYEDTEYIAMKEEDLKKQVDKRVEEELKKRPKF